MRIAILALAPLMALIALPATAEKAPEEITKTETTQVVDVETEQKPEQKPAETEAKAEVKPKAEKRICRHIRTDASSRRKTKVCRTNDEWREINRGN